MLPRSAVFGLLAALLLALPSFAHAGRAYRPPNHKIFHGVTDTGKVRDYRVFKHRVREHSALLMDFYHWDTPLGTGALHRWNRTDTRGVLSLSTGPGGQPEMISPRAIAKGHGDDYILGLNRSISQSRQVVYMRLFPEMNGSWNAYCAFNPNGSYRGRSHSLLNFRKAWRRIVTIIHGGKRKNVNHRLRHMDMPRIYRAHSNRARVYRRKDVPRRLPHPRVAFMWVPQTIGSPEIAANQASDYWPGAHWVDWVGADIYSKFATPGVWSAYRSFYQRYHGFPFVVGEYAPWDNDYSGSFTRRLFNWAESNRRVRAMVYYRSVSANNIFDINHWSRARRAIRHHLNHRRFKAYAPGTRD